MKKLTTEEIILRLKNRFGDSLDYSKVEYKPNSKGRITVTCPTHGDWTTTFYNMLKSDGCPKCKSHHHGLRINSITTENFIARCKKVHGDRYDYSKTVYMGPSKKVTITCPVHGDFQQLPWNHLTAHGCTKCGLSDSSKKRKNSLFYDRDVYINMAKKIHGNVYDYSMTEVNGCHSMIKFRCPKHGIIEKRADNHLTGKIQCQECYKEEKNSINLSLIAKNILESLKRNRLEKTKDFSALFGDNFYLLYNRKHHPSNNSGLYKLESVSSKDDGNLVFKLIGFDNSDEYSVEVNDELVENAKILSNAIKFGDSSVSFKVRKYNP